MRSHRLASARMFAALVVLAVTPSHAVKPADPERGKPMAWQLLHSDDFTGYANDAAFQAAYVINFTPSTEIVWSLTNGPGGVPGVKASTDPNNLSGGNFEKDLAPTSREFRVTGRFDNSHHPAAGQSSAQAIIVVFDTPGSGPFLTVGDAYHTDFPPTLAHGDLQIQLDTGDVPEYALVSSAFPTSTTSMLDVQGKVATSAQGDGYLRVLVDGVQVYSYAGPVNGYGVSPGWDSVFVDPGGKFTDLNIYQGIAIAPIPVATTIGPQTPCVPDSQVSDGGKGNAGCNVGGVGFVSQLPASPYGDVPAYSDPVDGETLSDKSAVDLWIEIPHTDYPTAVVTTYRRALVELGDLSTYQGGRKTEGLVAIGDIEHGLGNEQGGFESATVDIQYADQVDRLFRTLLDDQELEGDELRVKMASPTARAAGTAPRVLARSVIQKTPTSSAMQASLTAVDQLFSDFGPFGPGKTYPVHNIPSGAWLNMPPGVTEKKIPILYGEKSDEGAVNPVTNAPASKGLIPLQYVGQEDLGSDSVDPIVWTEDGGITSIPTPLTITNATGVGGDITVSTKVYLAAVKGGQISVLPNAVDVPTFDPLGVTEQDGVALAIHFYQQDAEVDYYIAWASDDMSFHPIDNPTAGNIGTATHDNATHDGWTFTSPSTETFDFTILIKHLNNSGVVKDNVWDAYLVHLGAGYATLNLYGSDLGNGVPTNKHDRVLIDTATRGGSDVLGPDWPNWPFAERYRDVVGDDGHTYRVTMIYARGPLSDDHKTGVVNMTVNAIGIEDVGDGTGLPIVESEKVKQHVIENHLINEYRSGLWVTSLTGPTWEDTTPKVRSTSFLATQDYLASKVGGVGITFGWYQADPMDVVGELAPAWNRSTDTKLGVNSHGQIVDFYLDEFVDTSAWPRVEHFIDIFGPVLRTAGEERENQVFGSCDWDPDADKFRVGPVGFESPTAITKYKNRRKKGDPVESKMLTVQAHLENVLQRRLTRLAEGVTLVDITGRINFLDYDVGQGILLTTIEGTGASGYVDRPMLILRRRFQMSPRLVTYTLLDLENILAADVGWTNTVGSALQWTNTTANAEEWVA